MRISDGWRTRSVSDIAFTLDSDTENGLSKNKVSINRRRWGKNSLWYTGSPFMYFRTESGFSALGYIFMAVAALSASAFGLCADSLWVCVSILVGIVLCSIMYLSAGAVSENNSRKWIPACTVIRDGKKITLRGDDLVLGDIVLLKKGDRVCADLKLVMSDDLIVTDPPFTKRKGQIRKAALGAMLSSKGESAPEDFVLAGSEILSGFAKAIVCAVGNETEQGKRGKIRLIAAKDPQRLLYLRRTGVTVGAVAMILAFAAIAVGVFSPLSAADFIGLFLIFLSFAVSAGGEIIPTICCQAYRSAISKSDDAGLVIRDASGIEYIYSCDGIAVENSSLMKANKTELRSLWISGETIDPKNSAGDDLLSLMLTGTNYGQGKYGKEVILAVNEHLADRIDPAKFLVANQNNKPVLEHKVIGATHYSLFQSGYEQYFSVTGSIEEVISKCTKVRIKGNEVQLDKERMSDILKTASYALKNASSIIAVAHRVSPYNSMKRLSVLTSDLTFIGFITMETPAHEGLPASLAYLRGNRIPFILFTDGSGEDINFARKLGVINSRNDLVNAKDPDNAVTDILREGSLGGAVYSEDSNSTSAFLKSAKRTGKNLVWIGSPKYIGDAGFTVVFDGAAVGSGSYVNKSAGSNITPVLDCIGVFDRITSRLRKAYVYLFVSALLRLIYSLTVLFGMPYVYPSVIIAWGLVFDAAIAGLIVSFNRK